MSTYCTMLQAHSDIISGCQSYMWLDVLVALCVFKPIISYSSSKLVDNSPTVNGPRAIYRLILKQNATISVSVDGTLHMWGRSSHVIYADKPPSWRVWRPQRVAIGSCRIRRIACGAWHVLAVTGIPG